MSAPEPFFPWPDGPDPTTPEPTDALVLKYVELRAFVTDLANGDIRHPVPVARRLLGLPVVATRKENHHAKP